MAASLLLAATAAAQPVPAGPEETPAAAPPGRTPLSAKASVPDSLLEQRLRNIYGSISALQDVRVSVENGVVQLKGTALSTEDRQTAETLARRFEGVAHVENGVTAETDLETRLTPALREARDFLRGTVAYLPLLSIALLVVLLFGGLGTLAYRWKAPYRRLGLSPLIGEWVRGLLRVVIILVGLVVALRILDATALVGALLGTAGIAGLALGFAFQDIVENYLAGALLSLRQPFAANDHVIVGDREGKVVRLTAREVVLMTLDGNHVSLPNSTVFKSVVTNFTRNPRRRFEVMVGIGTDEHPPEAIRVGTRALAAMHGVMAEPEPFARVEEIGDSSVMIRFFGWVDQREVDFLKVRSKAVRVLKAALDEAGIELPEPIYSVKMRPAGEPSPERPAPPEETAAAERAARAADEDTDISVDTDLEKQIREDRQASDEEDLLTGGSEP